MIVKCCVCEGFIREKEPFEDKRVSHGLCDECYEKERKKMREQLSVVQKNKRVETC
jgi:hypothetical protein